MSDDIWVRVDGRAGRITLNRPNALNALTWDMAIVIARTLDAWALDDEVRLVVIDGAGEKAFCAGGDIAELYRYGRAGKYDYGRRFWADEYRMNAKIHAFSKPYVAIMDGIVMGGGVGISAHGSHRVVTERSTVAMPETSIGLIPDVGGTWLLSRAPGYCGEYLAMTASRLGPGDAIYGGFADYFVSSARTSELVDALCETGDAQVIADFSAPPPAAGLKRNSSEIEAAFSQPNARACVEELEAMDTEFSHRAEAAIRRHSPLAVWAAMEAIHRARMLPSLNACLALEYRFTFRAQDKSEFLEGIRAAIIDKDRRPRWRPDRLEDLDPRNARALLASLGANELSFETLVGTRQHNGYAGA